jgi:hypothetical protein
MPRMGFEPMIPVFEWAKTFYALDHVGYNEDFIIATKTIGTIHFLMLYILKTVT